MDYRSVVTGYRLIVTGIVSTTKVCTSTLTRDYSLRFETMVETPSSHKLLLPSTF